jgi:hypothetical protein
LSRATKNYVCSTTEQTTSETKSWEITPTLPWLPEYVVVRNTPRDLNNSKFPADMNIHCRSRSVPQETVLLKCFQAYLLVFWQASEF